MDVADPARARSPLAEHHFERVEGAAGRRDRGEPAIQRHERRAVHSPGARPIAVHGLPDIDALRSSPTRIVVAVGEESMKVYTGRTAIALAEQLGQEPTVFPSHHGGFMGGEFGYAGQPEAFAAKLREVLDGS